MKPLLILIFLTGTGEKPQMEGAVSQGKILWFSVKVRDKSGRAVPNAQVALIAVDPEGNEYGPTFRWRTGAGTDAEGRGGMGFGNPVKSKPGKVVIVVTHPSISETRMAVEWSDILHERRPTRQTEPVFVLQARGGPGQAAWRKSVARKAPGLVKRLLEAEDEKEIDAITKELDAGEIGSFPALVDALLDKKIPFLVLQPLVEKWEV